MRVGCATEGDACRQFSDPRKQVSGEKSRARQGSPSKLQTCLKNQRCPAYGKMSWRRFMLTGARCVHSIPITYRGMSSSSSSPCLPCHLLTSGVSGETSRARQGSPRVTPVGVTRGLQTSKNNWTLEDLGEAPGEAVEYARMAMAWSSRGGRSQHALRVATACALGLRKVCLEVVAKKGAMARS